MNGRIEAQQPTPNLRRFARKVRWEGGVLAAMDYGLHSTDVPDPHLSVTWATVQDLYARLRPLVEELEGALEAA